MKKQRTPKLIQDLVARFIHQNIPTASFGALTTITDVQVNQYQSLAKIYLSFIPTGKKQSEDYFLDQIEQERGHIKKFLAYYLRDKLRNIPELVFYIDETAKKAIEMENRLAKL